jgi:RNA 2',3'-cyclic 3'-phosphodiesterase
VDGEPPSLRLFVALPVPEDAARGIEAVLAPYRSRFPGARWLPPGSLHLTLLFVGAAPSAGVPDLAALVQGVARASDAFVVRTGPGGGRARDGDGVAWLGLREGASRVMALVEACATACPPGLTPAGRPARPARSAHLTVARRADPALLRALRDEALGPLGVTWTADRVSLCRSHLGPGGARYEVLSESPLGAASGDGPS